RVGVDHVTITATLINSAPNETADGLPPDSNYLFQTGLRAVGVASDQPLVVVPRKLVVTGDDQDSRSNALIYRAARQFAAGHGVAAIWPLVNKPAECVATAWLPTAVVKSTSFKGHDSLEKLRHCASHPFAAAWLGSEGSRAEVVAA